MYAKKVFGDDKKWIEKYVNDARRLTKEGHDSVAIHPMFWAILQDQTHARIAIKQWLHDHGLD